MGSVGILHTLGGGGMDWSLLSDWVAAGPERPPGQAVSRASEAVMDGEMRARWPPSPTGWLVLGVLTLSLDMAEGSLRWEERRRT